MAAAMTDYLEDKLVDHTLGITVFTMPADVWIALFKVAPTDSETTGVGSEITNTDGNYLRLKIDQATLHFSPSSGGNSDNDENWDFTHNSSGAAWSVVGVGIFDADLVGNCLLYESFASISVVGGNTLRFAAGSFDVTFT